MRTFKTKIDGHGDTEFEFLCYENTEPIEIGDKFIFLFAGIADVSECCSENEKSEINKHDRPYQSDKIDLVYGFWRRCFKIKSTNFDLSKIS